MARFRLGTRAARRSLAAGRRLADNIRTLTSVPALLRARAAKQSERVRGQLAVEKMRSTPLAELKRVSNRNLRIADLERAGWTTVFDLLRADPEDLQRVHGVGPQIAAAIRKAAADLVARTAEELAVQIDPDLRTRESEELLRTLRMLLAFRRASSEADAAVAGLAPIIEETLEAAAPAGSRWKRAVSGAETRRRADRALADLLAWVDSPADTLINGSASRAVDAAKEAERLPQRRLWTEFQRNAAAYTTLLIEIDRGGPAGDNRAAQGFVPDHIVREVGDVDLDTSLLRVSLRTYQSFGARFALARRRCVLGDEMGLGKTVQAIAVLAHTAARGGQHFLVVCPASVLVNWATEIASHSQLLSHPAHGSGRAEATGRWLAQGGVAVTTFETLRRLPLPPGFVPDYLVVDEAHYIKNPLAQRTQAVNAVASRAPGVLMMTGTPLENKVEEFRDLVSYLDPEVAATVTSSEGVLGPNEFRSLVSSVYLRRNQEDVLTELPDSIELEDWVTLEAEDDRAYTAAVEAGNFTAMRRATVINGTDVRSAKLDRLVEIVAESSANGWKCVIFSFFLDVLADVDAALVAGVPGIRTFQLSGSIPAPDRQRMVDELGAVDGPAALISQITAGGVGLNVQAASVVIMMEPQLKPTIEQQAIARCRRMGQTRRVYVHRLLAKDTVDERIMEILGDKSDLIDAYARDSDAKHQDPEAIDGRMTEEMSQRIVDRERHRLGLRPDLTGG